ncbi:hypothetical protein C8Q72DRAFT_830124 [Fomitopsis betulina]|nr:hypothetical protein C8Q72DRAFT_830124 [Fomitopsis betulina]
MPPAVLGLRLITRGGLATARSARGRPDRCAYKPRARPRRQIREQCEEVRSAADVLGDVAAIRSPWERTRDTSSYVVAPSNRTSNHEYASQGHSPGRHRPEFAPRREGPPAYTGARAPHAVGERHVAFHGEGSRWMCLAHRTRTSTNHIPSWVDRPPHRMFAGQCR